MKKALLIVSFVSCSIAGNAQSFLSKLLDSSKVNSGTVSSILNKVVDGVTGAADIMPIEGTWVYSSPEIKFKSDNILASLGGEAVSAKIEGVLAKVYPKLGFDQNCKYVFNADSTFSHSFKIAGKVVKLDGTYSIDKSNKNIVFTYKVFGKISIGKVNAYYTNTGSSLSIVYEAEVLIKLLKKLVSAAGSISSAVPISTIEGLLDQYKGLQLGYKLVK